MSGSGVVCCACLEYFSDSLSGSDLFYAMKLPEKSLRRALFELCSVACLKNSDQLEKTSRTSADLKYEWRPYEDVWETD